jgi:PAS domain S-box-containing protein
MMPTHRKKGRPRPRGSKQPAVPIISPAAFPANSSDSKSALQARLLDLAHDAIIVREFGGQILYWNGGAASKYGWTREEAIGNVTHTMLRTVFPETRETTDRMLLAHGYWEGEVVHTRRDGSRITVASRQILDLNSAGKAPAVLEINRNITEQKEYEQRLRASEKALLDLTGNLLQSQDEERQRISHELHDTTSQILTGILSRLYLVRKSAQSLDEPSKQALSAALKLAEGLADFIRIFSSSLHPSILDEQGLAAAIRWYAEGINTQGNLRINVDTPMKSPRLPRTAERSLYRVAQECISRVRMRSATNSINVGMTQAGGMIVLEIGVEGGARALNLADLEAGILGQGAAGLRERMRQLGGAFELFSSDRGTVIRASLPLSPMAGEPATKLPRT